MSKRILVVEDQPDNRQIIRDMLAPADYEIINTRRCPASSKSIESTNRESKPPRHVSVSGCWSMAKICYSPFGPNSAAKPFVLKTWCQWDYQSINPTWTTSCDVAPRSPTPPNHAPDRSRLTTTRRSLKE
jgi:hypothetical protein